MGTAAMIFLVGLVYIRHGHRGADTEHLDDGGPTLRQERHRWSRRRSYGRISSRQVLHLRSLQRINRELSTFLVPASWFQMLNSFFRHRAEPCLCYALALRPEVRVGDLGFRQVPAGADPDGTGLSGPCPAAHVATGVKASELFLVATFLIHTVAELLHSPVDLSTASRLAPRASRASASSVR